MNSDSKPVATGTGRRQTYREKRRREQASPIIMVMYLLSQTLKQPLGLPTPDQAAEMKLLVSEVEKLVEYRRTHPKWR